MCLKRCRQTRCKNHNYQIASNCTNFIGAKSETQRSLSEIFEDKISHILQTGGTDQVTWKKSPTFRKPYEFGATNKFSTCDTISITKATWYKFQRRISNHTALRS